MQALLLRYVEREPVPSRVALWLPPPLKSGLLQLISSTLMAPVQYAYYLFTRPSLGHNTPAPLADAAILVLLVLVHYSCGTPGEQPNPFRMAFHAAQDSAYADTPNAAGAHARCVLGSAFPHKKAAPCAAHCFPRRSENLPPQTCLVTIAITVAHSSPEMGLGSVALVPFAALYETLGACLVDDRATLLLYSLIHGNGFFLEYVLVRGDLDALLVPLLEMLYHAPRRAPNQIYMLLIILLILSQDASFNAAAHSLVLPAIPWYQERMLRQTTLGSAIIIMLTRTVKYNLVQLRDVYLHTNCLAALANMAPHAANLSSYAAQRLVSLFEMLAKKYARLAQQAGVSLTWQPAEAQGAEARARTPRATRRNGNMSLSFAASPPLSRVSNSTLSVFSAVYAQ